ncbi:MAG: hypothetical protein HY243_06655 [Proteobacteria bacterium]|nr:hypothetical protein [Pseudomonadota bacterium]
MLLILAAFVALISPARADAVSTTTANGYGRMVFTLAPVASPNVALSNGVLTISFDRAVAIDATQIARGLNGYISTVRADADGKTFRFALSQIARLHISRSGNQFAVDLAPQGFAGTPPELPPPPPKQPVAVDVEKLPVLKVRSGMYANFTRMVFDWPQKIPYAIFPGSGHITLRFEAEARPDFSALTNNAPPWVKKASWRIENRGTVVDLETDADAGYHDFRAGTHVVLDVLAPRADADVYSPPQDDGKPGAKTKFIKLADSAKAAKVTSAQAQEVADTAQKLNAKPAEPTKSDSKKTDNPQASDTSKTPAAEPVKTDAQAVQTAQQTALTTPPAATDASSFDANAAAAQRTKDGAVLIFPHAGSRTVAVFVRGTTAWVVIDGAIKIDPAALKTALKDFPASLDSASGNGVSVLRLALKQQEQIFARADGKDLKVILAPRIPVSLQPITFTRTDSDAKHASLGTLVPGAVRPVTLNDPAVGDELTIVPGLVGYGVSGDHRYVEFAALPTAAGLVLTPFVDDLAIAVANARVTIGRPGGLDLTPPSLPAVDTPAALARNTDGPAFLNFALWANAKNKNFLGMERRLRSQIAAQNSNAANPARLALARFYLANGFSAEALGLINLIQASDPALQSDMQLQTMRGAADFMMARYRDAHNDLSQSMFDNDRHAALWRGLTEAALENWSDARRYLLQADPVLGRYSADWQARARIAEARAALSVNNLVVADQQLNHLPRDLDKPIMLDAQLARARLYVQENRYRDARTIFTAVEHSGDERAAANAIYERVNAGLIAGAITPDAAADQLESLRFRWRGDALELKTLRKLGAIYFARKRWREGLGVLRAASQNFPNEELARQAQDDMRRAFENLFLKGGADRLRPVDALALFYDNIDLTPIGPNGDEMIRRMTERLVAVDLLGPAAALLDYQVNKRLDGVAQAQVATRLAMIELMDHKPKEALAALRETRLAGLPDDVNHQRVLLEARALAALKQWDQALDMIAVDEQPDSRQLRADIYWESGNWAVAGQKSEELLGGRWQDGAALNDSERRDVMRAAIAYSLAEDQTSLNRLRDHFGPKMKASVDAPAFAVVTQDIETRGLAFRDMAGRIASVDTLETFMQDFKKRYGSAVATN